jgi:hypothetical protein
MLVSISMTPDESHALVKEAAKKMGLVHVGFGNYAKTFDGAVVYRVARLDDGTYDLLKVEHGQPAGTKIQRDRRGRDISLDVEGKSSFEEAVHGEERFSSSDAHNEWSETVYKDWYKSLTKAEREALVEYKGNKYFKMNEGLRNGFSHGPISAKEGAKFTKTLDAAIYKSSLPDPITAFRGIVMPEGMQSPNFDYSHLVGTELSDKAYSSVTTRTEVTKDFMSSAGPDTIFISMELPQGCPAASMNKGVSPLMNSTYESELLLPRGMKFMVKKVEKLRKDQRPPAHVVHVVPIFPEKDTK